jgi:DNA-binding response OmpR family regulator
MSEFPAVVLTLNPRLFSLSMDEIVVNYRTHAISRGKQQARFQLKRNPLQFPVMCRLLAARGSAVNRGDLTDFVYGDRKDGGPDTGDRTLNPTIHRLRLRVPLLGLSVSNSRGWGWRLVDTARAARAAA